MMFERLYFRRDGTPYPPGDAGLWEWCDDFAKEELRIVRQDKLPDGTEISTIWLGIDHDHHATMHGLPHLPLMFETMVWGPDGNIALQMRYRSENDAIAGHMEIV